MSTPILKAYDELYPELTDAECDAIAHSAKVECGGVPDDIAKSPPAAPDDLVERLRSINKKELSVFDLDRIEAAENCARTCRAIGEDV